MSGARQAALVLHGLAPADRDWMLERLSEPRRQELGALLQELQSLGLPPDAELIRRATSTAPGLQAPAASASRPSLATLASATAQQMHELLHGEPDRLVALVVSSSAWAWKDRFLMLLGDERARRVREIALLSSAGPSLRQAVLDRTSQRLAQMPSTAGRTVDTLGGVQAALAPLRRKWAAWKSR